MDEHAIPPDLRVRLRAPDRAALATITKAIAAPPPPPPTNPKPCVPPLRLPRGLWPARQRASRTRAPALPGANDDTATLSRLPSVATLCRAGAPSFPHVSEGPPYASRC